VLGGGGQSIGLYAAGLAVRHGAVVDYVDDRPERLEIADAFGARVQRDAGHGRKAETVLPGLSTPYDIAVEASSRASGVRTAIRALGPGGVCTAIGYYLAPGTKVPLMHMYANDITLRVGISHVRPVLPELLEFVAREKFPAEWVTTMTADWEDAPGAYSARTTKLVLVREPLRL
jgi:alcohol dehydrogenase